MTDQPDHDEARAKIHRAREMVSDLCHRRRQWTLSIPVDQERDPDFVISAGLRAGFDALAQRDGWRARWERSERDRKDLHAKLCEATGLLALLHEMVVHEREAGRAKRGMSTALMLVDRFLKSPSPEAGRMNRLRTVAMERERNDLRDKLAAVIDRAVGCKDPDDLWVWIIESLASTETEPKQ